MMNICYRCEEDAPHRDRHSKQIVGINNNELQALLIAQLKIECCAEI